jgi:hypothetical protein
MAGLATIKVLPNSVISKPTSHFMTAGVKNFYVNTPLEQPEYTHIPVKLIPQEIIDNYQLTLLVHNDYVDGTRKIPCPESRCMNENSTKKTFSRDTTKKI